MIALYWIRGIFLALITLIIAVLSGTMIGETSLAPDLVLSVLANMLAGLDLPIDPVDQGIIWSYRLPRALVAAACGAALAVTGVVLQALLRNVLADPYILGISAGASTGAVAVSIAGIGGGAFSLSFGAFNGALLAFGFVAVLARAAGATDSSTATSRVVLAGIAGSQLFNALTAFVIAKSANSDQARGILFWLMGNLSGVRWPDVWTAVSTAVAGCFLCWYFARALDAFTFGSDSAASLGVSVRPIQAALILATALMTAVIVSIVGSIGFVGLVIPHAARFIVGPGHSRLIPASALIGAVFLVGVDIVSRIVIPGQVLPIGVVTALVGAPAFAMILVRGQRYIH